MNDIANEERQATATRKLRMARARRLVVALTTFVIAPTLAAVVYYGLWVTPQYESVAVLAIEAGEHEEAKQSNKNKGEATGLHVVREHILSRAMLDALTKDNDLLAHFQSGDIDWWSRLPANAGTEEVFDYYQDQVVMTDTSEETLELHVYAFSAEQSHAVANAIIEKTNRHLASQAEIAREAVVRAAEERVESAREDLAKAGTSKSRDGVDAEVARARLTAATRALELAEGEAARRRRSLWVVAKPSSPNEPSRPRRLWNIFTVFITTLALGGMTLLLGDFVREHAKF